MSRFKLVVAGLALATLLAAPLAHARERNDEPSALMIKEAYDDSAEAIKLRSGPGDALAGARKSFLCQGCHGTVGISTEPLIPKLAGQYGEYIAKEVRNYQSGARSHPIMNAMAGTVENATDLADIAAYFASQQKMEGDNSPSDPLGESLFMHGDMSKGRLACFGCHGIKGKGDGPTSSMFPVLGGQQKEYIQLQLMNFRAGIRTNSPAGIMNMMTKKLTDEEIDALADYISRQ